MQQKEDIIQKLSVFDTKDFTFDEENHIYQYKGKEMVSVTTFIKQFTTPFDTEYWSDKKAIEAMELDEVEFTEENKNYFKKKILEKWDSKKEVGCDLGTLVHKAIEQMFNGEEITPLVDKDAINRFEKFKKIYIEKLKDIIVNIAQERRIFSTKLKIAGTIDCMLLRLKENIWNLEIWDWKTNKKFKTDNDRCFQNLLPPFQQEFENEHNLYSIQLCLYTLILASVGIFVGGELVVVYIPPFDEKPRVIKCKKAFVYKLESYFGVDYYSKLEKSHTQTV